MPDLSRDLRRALTSTIEAARVAAEIGAAEALHRLGVFDSRRPGHLDEARNETRKRLRAHARSFGDGVNAPDGEPLRRLTEAAAYVQWHRLLFARFLLERGLLRDETGVALALSDCREEAAMDGTGDEWSIASAHAALMLPGVFPAADPVEALVLAPKHAKALRDHLLKLDPAIFQADDSLGWTYQFWRAAEKKRVDESGVKIGAAELPAVTQLFTEPYMVRLLLHNTLGAWWAGKVLATHSDLARDAANEDQLRAACALPGYVWDFLRFVRENDVWRPAAGVFPGWPVTAAALTVLDPCRGSGHFLTEALSALAALRGAEEGLSPAEAVVSVLRDNLAGLEIDGRCVQIAAFALAVTAWRIGGAGVALPTPHVAWVGGPPPLPKAEFAALGNGDAELRRGLEALHDLFVRAPILGSLIEPVGGDLVDPSRVARIEDSIVALIGKIRDEEPERTEGVLAARGIADAVSILSRHFALQLTNVPFLGRTRQDIALAEYLNRTAPEAQADLATAMIVRMLRLAIDCGTIGVVSPQQSLFLSRYQEMRKNLLKSYTFDTIGGLGARAFESVSGEIVNAALIVSSAGFPGDDGKFSGIDVNTAANPTDKSEAIRTYLPSVQTQSSQFLNPDSKITLDSVSSRTSLSNHTSALAGCLAGDSPRYIGKFWETPIPDGNWELHQTTFNRLNDFGGREEIIFWEQEQGVMYRFAQSVKHLNHVAQNWLRGKPNWGKWLLAVWSGW